MPAPDLAQPFALFESADRTARLFTGLGEVVAATTADEVGPALQRVRRGCGHRVGFVGFDAGYALEPTVARFGEVPPDGLPPLWFGTFGRVDEVDPAAVLPDEPVAVGALRPSVDEAGYVVAVADILDRIAAGDLYQANLTFQATVAVTGAPAALYRRLRGAAGAGFGALLHTGDSWLLSFSPELFFALRGGRVTTRPMKGTARRGATEAADAAAAAALAADPKNRAENLMIVDLLRNDLTRIAEPGSVRVDALFDVERYPTLLQMTSTISAATGCDAIDVLAALFPCGSVTGAPKIAAMRAIAAIEKQGRGVYTGSIGIIEVCGDAVFNVAIRTLVMTRPGEARIGLGAGIVADSVAADEWRECLAKAAFLHRDAPRIIETMRVDAGVVHYLPRHLDRAAATAAFLGYRFDRTAVAAAVAATAPTGSARLRLLLDHDGVADVALSPLPPPPVGPVVVAIASLPVACDDWRLRHKTTDRAFYDDARRASGAFEVVFITDGEITEGSFTSVFVPAADGRLLTPPLAAGLLPGVLRAALIEEGRAVEALLGPADLANGFFVGNAVRGLIPAVLAGEPVR